jgi:hypothetical protein
MVGTIRKVISFLMVMTTLVVAIRELKNALDSLRKKQA